MDEMDIDVMQERHDAREDKADIEIDTSGDHHRGIQQYHITDDHTEYAVEDRFTRADRAGKRYAVGAEPAERLQRVDIDHIDLHTRQLGDVVQRAVEHQHADGDIGDTFGEIQQEGADQRLFVMIEELD